jgi:hypothetical protein
MKRPPPKANGACQGAAAEDLPKSTGELLDSELPAPVQGGQLIDRYGHLHSEAIFKNWSPAAIKALGIRRVEVEP